MQRENFMVDVSHFFYDSVGAATATAAVPSVDEKVSASLSYKVKHFASMQLLIYCRKSWTERNL